jgi:hypothetical protein
MLVLTLNLERLSLKQKLLTNNLLQVTVTKTLTTSLSLSISSSTLTSSSSSKVVVTVSILSKLANTNTNLLILKGYYSCNTKYINSIKLFKSNGRDDYFINLKSFA